MTTPTRGICGPHSIAQVIDLTTRDVILDWIGGYKGFAPLREMKAMLDFYGAKYKWMPSKDRKNFDLAGYNLAIARIQWLPEGDDEGQKWGHWAEAQMHTHYVSLKRVGDKVMVNCDGDGIFEANTTDYLDFGEITSYLYIL